MDIRSKYTVYGYIRRCEFEFLLDSSDDNQYIDYYIPDKIYNIILIFYYFVQDYFASYGFDITTDVEVDFDSKNKNNNQQYKEINQKYITSIINLGKTSSSYNTAYGRLLINPFECKIHKWEFKIHRSNGDCYIGIDSSLDSKINESFINKPYNIYGRWQNLEQFYAISSMGYKYSHYTFVGKESNGDVMYSSGDNVKIIIDFNDEYGIMSISINGGKYIKIFHMIPKSKINPHYRLAVSLSVGSYIELLSYCYSEQNSNLDLYKRQIDQ